MKPIHPSVVFCPVEPKYCCHYHPNCVLLGQDLLDRASWLPPLYVVVLLSWPPLYDCIGQSVYPGSLLAVRLAVHNFATLCYSLP